METSSPMSTSNQYVKYTITIDVGAQNIANNSTRVTVSVRFYRTNTGYSTYGTGTVYCTINGTKYSSAVTSSQKITSSGIVLFSKTLDIKHDSNGVGTITCSAYINHQVLTSNPQSFSITPKAIPLSSSFGTISGNTIGGSMTVNISRKSSSHTHGLWYKIGNSGWKAVATSGIGTSKSFTIDKALCSQLPNSTSGTLTLLLKTYNGSTQIGASQKTVTVYVPSDVKPSLRIAISDDKGYAETYGGYLVGLSKVRVTLTGTTSYESPLVTYTSTLNGVTYGGLVFTSNVLKTAGTLTVNSKVTDRRGRSGTASTTLTAIEYKYPRVTQLTVRRCDSYGNDDNKGSYVKVLYSYEVTPLNNKNVVAASLKYKKTGTSTFTTINLTGKYNCNNESQIFAADTGSSYDVMLSIGDNFKTIDRSTTVSTAFTILHFNKAGNGLGVGKISEYENVIDVGMDLKATGDVYGNVVGMGKLPEIPAYSDFNDYLTTGCWAVYRNNIAVNISNIPVNVAGRLECWSSTGEGVLTSGYTYIHQRFIPYRVEYAVWERDITRNGTNDNVTYYPWCRTSLTKEASDFVYGSHSYEPAHSQKLLWSGGYYMNEDHTITISNVQDQDHGIVLVFSKYSDGAAQNHNFNTFFIPKSVIKDNAGRGFAFTMHDNSFLTACTKYLYISSTTISGHANNSGTGTGRTGITYNNKAYVLRAVYGV